MADNASIWQAFDQKFAGPPLDETADQKTLRLASNRGRQPGVPNVMPPAPVPTTGAPTGAAASMPSFEDGGVVEETGPAIVHKGERIYPADSIPPADPGTPLMMPPAPLTPPQQSAKAPSFEMPPAPIFPGTPVPGSLQPQASTDRRAQLIPDDGKPLSGSPPNTMPPAPLTPPKSNAPATSFAMPPAGTPARGSLQPESSSNGPAGFMPPAPTPVPEKTIPNMDAPTPQAPELHGWKKALDAIGSVFPIGRAIETAIPGTPQNFDAKRAGQAARDEMQAGIRQKNAQASQEEARAESLRNPQKESAEEQTFADLISQGVPPIDAYRQVKQAGEKQTAPEKYLPGQGRVDPKTGEVTIPVPAKAGATTYERATIADPKDATKSRDVLFDRTSGQYLDPDTKQPIQNARAFEKPAAGDEKDKEISDYLAANNLTDTAANRDKARTAMVARNRVGGYGEPGGDLKLSGDAYLQSLDAPERAMVSEIGTGHAAPDRIAYILARNPKLTAEVGLAYPDFDSSKLASYVSTYKDFTSGPASVAINAGNTALLHLNELRKLNTNESRVPGTKDYQKYQNKLDTITTELGRFYGNTTLEGIAGYRKTLGATFNRDAAITTQAQSMGDKLSAYENQWKNAAPSKAYEAPLPGISDAAKQARAELDPNYKAAAATGEARAGGAKTYTDAEVQAAVAAHPGQTAAQIESAYKAKGYSKQ